MNELLIPKKIFSANSHINECVYFVQLIGTNLRIPEHAISDFGFQISDFSDLIPSLSAS